MQSYFCINPKICIIGGGAGGIEIALSLRNKFNKIKEKVEITIIHKGEKIVEFYPKSVRNKILKTLESKNIQLILNEKEGKIYLVITKLMMKELQNYVKVFQICLL